jgi:hypothetical protein
VWLVALLVDTIPVRLSRVRTVTSELYKRYSGVYIVSLNSLVSPKSKPSWNNKIFCMFNLKSHTLFLELALLQLHQWLKDVTSSLDEENKFKVSTGYCYGVVSYKASHALRPFSDLLCVPVFWVLVISDASTTPFWKYRKRHLVVNHKKLGEK